MIRPLKYYGALLMLIRRETGILWPTYLVMFNTVPLMALFIISAHNGTRLQFLAVTPSDLPVFFTWAYSVHTVLLLGFGALMVAFITIYGFHYTDMRISTLCLMERPVTPVMIYTLRCFEWGLPVVVCAVLSMPLMGVLIILGFTLFGANETAAAAWQNAAELGRMAGRGMAWLGAYSGWWAGTAILTSFAFSRWWTGTIVMYVGISIINMMIGPASFSWAMPAPMLSLAPVPVNPEQFGIPNPSIQAFIAGLGMGAVIIGYALFKRRLRASD